MNGKKMNGTTSVPKSVPRSVVDKVRLVTFGQFPCNIKINVTENCYFAFIYLLG